MEFKGRNVNHLFHKIVRGIADGTIPTTASPSRYGNVKVITEPVTITYEQPLECVLFNKARDVNPFACLFEGLWTLSGSNEIESISYYTPKLREFSDDGKTWNDAYGYRWRHARGSDPIAGCDIEVDQLNIIIRELKTRPESRRVVLQMWNVEDDLLKIDPKNKAVCCNLSCLFLLNPKTKCLDLTVINRSNDLIWGTLCVNVVEFSILLEYVANCLNVPVGIYHQISNNSHVYQNNFFPEKWLPADGVIDNGCYEHNWTHIKLVQNQNVFDQEVVTFVGMPPFERAITNWSEPFLQEVAAPMAHVFNLHKQRLYSHAMKGLELIKDDAWRLAATQWITKRKQAWEAKEKECL